MKLTVKQLRRIIKEEVSKSRFGDQNETSQSGFVILKKAGVGSRVMFDTVMFDGKIFPSKKEAIEAAIELDPEPGTFYGFNEHLYSVESRDKAANVWGIEKLQTPEEKKAYKERRKNQVAQRGAPEKAASKLAKEIAKIVGHGVKAKDLTHVADLVRSLVGTDDPEDAIDQIADELGNVIMDSMSMGEEEDELDFDAYAAASDVAAAFGIS